MKKTEKGDDKCITVWVERIPGKLFLNKQYLLVKFEGPDASNDNGLSCVIGEMTYFAD